MSHTGDEEIRLVEIQGGAWTTSPVTETPEIQLSDWQIWETERGERHFVGYNLTEHEGRASSAIQTFDRGTMRGITSSGRVYELVGPPGHDADAAYTWNRWMTFNKVITAKEVTHEATGPVL
jgi:hypothetical protein